MMMERPKPQTSSKEKDQGPPPATSRQEDDSTVDPIKRLERRLAKLGGPVVVPETGQVKEEDPAPSTTAAAPLAAAAARVEQSRRDVAAAQKSALLVRLLFPLVRENVRNI